MITWAASSAVVAGFQTTVLPTIAGATARFPPIEVKLKGLIASTKPSSGRWSMRFHTPGDDTGCISRSCSAKWTFQRQKSISSQAASISACWTLLLCPRIVAALRRSRNGPLRRSAARRKTEALVSQGAVDQSWWAASAASTAARTSSVVAVAASTSAREWRCGALTEMPLPVPVEGASADVERHGVRRGCLHVSDRGAQVGALRRARRVEVNRLVERWLRTHLGDCGAASV